MARRGKSIKDIESQRNRIIYAAVAKYGVKSDRFVNIRHKVLETAKRYNANIFNRHFKKDTIEPQQVSEKSTKKNLYGTIKWVIENRGKSNKSKSLWQNQNTTTIAPTSTSA